MDLKHTMDKLYEYSDFLLRKAEQEDSGPKKDEYLDLCELIDSALGLLMDQEWVGADEYLPEPDVPVLCAMKLCTGKVVYQINQVDEGTGEFYIRVDGDQVTHWMTLPELPKGGEQDD